MNIHERGRKSAVGTSLLEEVVAYVLREARDNGEEGMTQTEVAKRAAMHWDVCGGVLRRMAQNEEAVNEGKGGGGARWRLTE